jgi:hypothetical protein
MIVIPLRQLHGSQGTLAPGKEHNVPDDLANDLLKRGLVRSPYETKVITPPSTQDIVPPTPPTRRNKSIKTKAPR